jgi:hypothetical protein
LDEDNAEEDDAEEDVDLDLQLLEAHHLADSGILYLFMFTALAFTFLGTENMVGNDMSSTVVDSDLDRALRTLQDIVNSPPDIADEYTRLKKDIFHAFHMIPTPAGNGLRPAFVRALRDHTLRWDPASRDKVDAVCRESFNLTFDQMLLRNPRFIRERIRERTPRHAPSPSVLSHAIQFVIDTFGDTVDARGNPLFSATTWQKAHSILELAKQGYLSDVDGVVLYERAGIDKYGLQKWKCLRGTNNVEGGPHGDIYRKFGALHGTFLTIYLSNNLSFFFCISWASSSC